MDLMNVTPPNTNQLNIYLLEKNSDEISPTVLQDPKSDLMRIPKMLGDDLLPHFRRAQSIITRSEAELLGISSPRFAARVYFSKGGFINCRRLAHFTKSSLISKNHAYGKRYPDDAIDKLNRNPDLKEIEHEQSPLGPALLLQSCVADCLLAEPDRMSRHQFHYVDVNAEKLFDIYTEPRPANIISKQYTPYVKTIDFGGGMCAQAVCFMATTMLSDHARTLCGLAEITAYAHDDKCFELSLSGLTPESMQRYFSRVDLNMSEQAPSQSSHPLLSSHEQAELATVLRCYLRANVPVIYPVDCRKMASVPSAEESIYWKNAFPISQSRFPQEAPHVVVLVGYLLSSDVFVLHDPFVFPYMTAHISKLGAVGCQRGIAPNKTADNGVFMPVTPSDVKLPLLWERRQDSKGNIEHYVGLFTISKTLHTLLHNLTHPTAFSFAHKLPFFLSRTCPTVEDLNCIASEGVQKLATEIEKRVAYFHELHGWREKRWLWYEMHVDCVWIWNAELPPTVGLPEDAFECLRYLVGICRLKYDGENVTAESISVNVIDQ